MLFGIFLYTFVIYARTSLFTDRLLLRRYYALWYDIRGLLDYTKQEFSLHIRLVPTMSYLLSFMKLHVQKLYTQITCQIIIVFFILIRY